jgi:hypothetical protein
MHDEVVVHVETTLNEDYSPVLLIFSPILKAIVHRWMDSGFWLKITNYSLHFKLKTFWLF